MKEENTILDLIVAHEKKPGPAAESHSGHECLKKTADSMNI